jgi:hypothetical protein
VVVHSTVIRRAIADGDAARNRPSSVRGRVVHGSAGAASSLRRRTLSANPLVRRKVCPTRAEIDRCWFDGVTSIGDTDVRRFRSVIESLVHRLAGCSRAFNR